MKLIVIFVILAADSAMSAMKSAYKFSVFLNYDKTISLKWNILSDRSVVYHLEAETKGYIGVGFSPNGGMPGADILLAYFDENGDPVLKDMYASDFAQPELDDLQSYTLIEAYRNDTHQIFTYIRDWDTCDKQDLIFQSASNNVIWARGDEIPVESNGQVSFNYHGKERGLRTLYLNSKNSLDLSQIADAKIWEIQAQSTTRPPNGLTDYNCKIVKFPEIDEKHHIIGAKIDVPEAYKANAHHITIYTCEIPEQIPAFQEIKQSEQQGVTGFCYFGTPKSWYLCNSPIIGWSIGMDGFLFPEHIGIPIEKNKEYYFRVETHFDYITEPVGIPEVNINVFYTPNLRKFDGSLLTMGSEYTDKIIIPPKQNSWDLTVDCSDKCLGESIMETPDQKINIYAVVHHTHLFGRKIKVQHIRDGVELDPISEDPFYNFDYQSYLMLDEEREILPGDRIIVTCTYDTSERDKVIYSGLGTPEEMCLVYINYYPMMSTYHCRNMPIPSTTEDVFNFTFLPPYRNHINSEISMNGENVNLINYLNENADTIFNEDNLKKFKNNLETDNFYEICIRKNPLKESDSENSLSSIVILKTPLVNIFLQEVEKKPYTKREIKSICDQS